MTIEQLSEDVSLSKLMEGELERAEVILAARDTIDQLQKMAEDLAKLSTEDVMPLVDQIKSVFGTEAGDRFNGVAESELKNALDVLRLSKDKISNQVLQLEGKGTPDAMSTDMANMGASDAEEPAVVDGEGQSPEASTETAPEDDPFAGSESASGPVDEPLGRARKESVALGGNMVVESESEEYVIYNKRTLKITKKFNSRKEAKEYFDSEGLTKANYALVPKSDLTDDELKNGKLKESLNSELEGLVTWVLRESETRLRPTQLLNFTRQLALHAARDPRNLTEWLTRKKQTMLEESKVLREYFEGEVHANLSRLQNGDPKAHKLGLKIYDMIKGSQLPDEEKTGWTNVLSHFAMLEDDPSSWSNPEDKFAKSIMAARVTADAESAPIANALKKLVYHFHMKHDVDEGIVQLEQPIEEKAAMFKIDAETAQAIWGEKNLDAKRQLALQVVDNFKASKESKALEKVKITAMKSTAQIDRWVSNMALHGDGLGLGMGRQGLKAGLELNGQTIEEGMPLNPAEKKAAATGLAKISAKSNASNANQSIDQVTKDLDGPEKAALKKVGDKIKSTTGKPATKAGDFTSKAALAIESKCDDNDHDDEDKELDENVMFASPIKTGDYGQNQGTPFQTDYRVHKAVTGGVGSTNKGKTSTAKVGGKSGEVKPITDVNATSVGHGNFGQNQGTPMSTDAGKVKANTNKPMAKSTAKPQPLKPSSSTPLAQTSGKKVSESEGSNLTVRFQRGIGSVREKTFESVAERDAWVNEANATGYYKIIL